NGDGALGTTGEAICRNPPSDGTTQDGGKLDRRAGSRPPPGPHPAAGPALFAALRAGASVGGTGPRCRRDWASAARTRVPPGVMTAAARISCIVGCAVSIV